MTINLDCVSAFIFGALCMLLFMFIWAAFFIEGNDDDTY